MTQERVGKKLETTKLYLLASTGLNIVLGVVTVYLVYQLAYQAMNIKTMLQPAFPIDKPIELGWNNGEIEKSNLKKIGELITLWTMSYTPRNARKRFYKILPFVGAHNFKDIKDVLDGEIYKIKTNKITQAFHPSTIEVEKEKIVVYGVAMRSSAGQKLDAMQMQVIIYYTYTPQTGFEILSIKRRKGR